MRILVFNDPHFSPKPPASRKSSYTDCLLRKLREIVKAANDLGADVLACTGDWVISKRPEATPYWLAASIADILRDYQGTLVSAIGNHDAESTLEFFARSPIYTMFRAAGVRFDTESGCVYQTKAGVAQIVVVNFDKGATAEGILEVAKASFSPECLSNRILVVHGPIVRPEARAEYPEQFLVKAIDPTRLIGCADLIFYGDIHDPHGQYELHTEACIGEDDVVDPESTLFVNYGAIARNSAKELNRIRPVQAAFYDTETKEVQPLELEDVDPAEDVFLVEDLQREREVAGEVNLFVDALDPKSLSFTVLTPDILRERISNDALLTDVEKGLAIKAVNGAS